MYRGRWTERYCSCALGNRGYYCALTTDILGLHPRNISDQNTHCRPEPSKPGPVRFKTTDELGVRGEHIRIPLAQLRMKKRIA